jgi:hypothetical protein
MTDADDVLRKRSECKALSQLAQQQLQDAHDQLVMAKAAAKSELDPVLTQAQDEWRKASADYSKALDEYTRLLGPRSIQSVQQNAQ